MKRILSLPFLAGTLALIGGTLLIAFGLMAIYTVFIDYFTLTVPVLGIQSLFTGGVITVALGAMAIAASVCASKRACGAILLVVSVVTGGVGGTLVFLGAFLGLISRQTKREQVAPVTGQAGSR